MMYDSEEKKSLTFWKTDWARGETDPGPILRSLEKVCDVHGNVLTSVTTPKDHTHLKITISPGNLEFDIHIISRAFAVSKTVKSIVFLISFQKIYFQSNVFKSGTLTFEEVQNALKVAGEEHLWPLTYHDA